MPVKINGSTSGSVTLAAPATGSDVTLTLPNSTGTAATTSYADGAGGLVFITSQAFTSTSTVNVNSCFTSSYSAYRVVLSFTTSGAANIQMRLRASGVDESANQYFWTTAPISSGTGSPAAANGGSGGANTFARIGYAQSTTQCFAVLDVNGPQTATYTNVLGMFQGTSSSESFGGPSVFHLTTTTQYDGFTIYNATMTGSVRVYGYRSA